MKNIIYFLLGAVLLVSCKSEYGKYDGDSVVYLSGYTASNSGKTNKDTTIISFTYLNKDSTHVPVYLQLKTMGRMVNYDREIKLKVTTKQCEAGVDFDPIEETQILPANDFIGSILVNLKRTDALQEGNKIIDIELLESKDFAILYKEYHDGKDTLSGIKHTIIFSELMDTPPSTWNAKLFGAFSAKKFITICNELNISREKFIDVNYMSIGRRNYIKAQMIIVFQKAKEAGNTIYEADGVTEMTMG